MVAGVVLASVAVWTAVAVVDAAVLCQKKTGAVFVREACKKKETAVDVTSLLGTLPTRLTAVESSLTALQSAVDTADDVREILTLTGIASLLPFTHDADLAQLSFTNTVSGRARISVSIAASATCSGGVPFGVLYLQVDGVDVPDSGVAIQDSGTIVPARIIGTTAAAVEPGTHTVQIALDCLTGGSGFAYGPHIDGDVIILRVSS